MSVPLILRSEAEEDLREIYAYLNPIGQAQKFVDILRSTLDRIESFPQLYGFVWQGGRAVRLKKFMYVLYYVVQDDYVEVLAVIHGSRHESAWKSRV
jgi:plasmid stabilization system protein ParE